MRAAPTRRSGRRGSAAAILASSKTIDAQEAASSSVGGEWSIARAFAMSRRYASPDLAAGAVLGAALPGMHAGFALAVGADGEAIASAATPTAAHDLTLSDYEQTMAAAATALDGGSTSNGQVSAFALRANGQILGALALMPTAGAEAEAFKAAGGMLAICLAEMLSDAEDAEAPPASASERQSVERQRLSERLIDALASHGDGVALFDADGGLVAANPAFAAAHDAKVRDLKGLTLEEILRRRDDRLSPAWLGKDLRAGDGGSHFALGSNGNWLRLARSVSPTGDSMILQSPADELVSAAADARRYESAIEDAATERLTVWDGVAVGIVMLSEAGRVLDVNGEAARLLGASARRLKGRRIGRIDGHDSDSWSRIRQNEAEAPTLAVKARRLADGRTLLTMLEALPDATKPQTAAATRVQRALAAADALGELGHEMRTPLNAVIGFADIMLARSFGPINDRQSQYLDDIARAGRHMLEMVEHMFDHAQLTAGRYPFSPEWVNLPELLHEASRLLQPAAVEGNVRLAVGPVPEIEAHIDRRGILQALINLLTNGVKFTPPGGEVMLSAELGHQTLDLKVSDTGEGIPEADLERVLEPFTQARRLGARPLKGAGLGLSIVTALAELHDGSVSVQSALGHGAEVSIRLPGSRARQARPK